MTEDVKIWKMGINVNVKEDIMETIVNMIQMIVIQIHVKIADNV